MWAIALLLAAAVLAGILAEGGPALWLAIVVGLAFLGANPTAPLSATVAALAAWTVATYVRSALAHRLN